MAVGGRPDRAFTMPFASATASRSIPETRVAKALQCLVCGRDAARIASGMPGASRSITSRVASGVRSFGVKPVPPVVRTSSQPSSSAQWRRRSAISSRSSLITSRPAISAPSPDGEPVHRRVAEARHRIGALDVRRQDPAQRRAQRHPLGFQRPDPLEHQPADFGDLDQLLWHLQPSPRIEPRPSAIEGSRGTSHTNCTCALHMQIAYAMLG